MNQKRQIILLSALLAAVVIVGGIVLWKLPEKSDGSGTTAPMGIHTDFTTTGPSAQLLPFINYEVVSQSQGCAGGAAAVSDGRLLTVKASPSGTYSLYADDGWLLDMSMDVSHVIQAIKPHEGRYYILYTQHPSNDLYLDIYAQDGTASLAGQFVSTGFVEDDWENSYQSEGSFYMGIHGDTLYILSQVWYNGRTGHLRLFDLSSCTLLPNPYPLLSALNPNYMDMAEDGTLYLGINGGASAYLIFPDGENERFPFHQSYWCRDMSVREDIYVLSRDSLDRYTPKGDFVETCVSLGEDIALLTFHTPYGNASSMEAQSADCWLLTYYDESADGTTVNTLVRIERQWVETLPQREYDTQLVFTVGQLNPNIDYLLKIYAMNNPRVNIVRDIMVSERAQATVAVGNQLATRLIAGDVGDIFEMGEQSLNYYDLLRTDVFMDLKPLLERDGLYDLLYEHNLNAIMVDGAIRGLPLITFNPFFLLDVAQYEKLGIELDFDNLTASQLIDAARVMQAQGVMTSPVGGPMSDTYEDFLDKIIFTNLYELIDIDTYQFDLRQPWFVQLMEDFKSIYQPAATGVSLLKPNSLSMEYAFLDIQTEGMFAGKRYVPMMKSEINGHQLAFSPYILAIPSVSENKEAAWEVLKFMVSIEGQRAIVNFSPVNIQRDEELLASLKQPQVAQSIRDIRAGLTHLYEIAYVRGDILGPLLEYMQDKLTLEQALEKAEYNLLIRLKE